MNQKQQAMAKMVCLQIKETSEYSDLTVDIQSQIITVLEIEGNACGKHRKTGGGGNLKSGGGQLILSMSLSSKYCLLEPTVLSVIVCARRPSDRKSRF